MRPTVAPAGRRRFDDMTPVDAVVAAWREPGVLPDWHEATIREVHRVAPLLGRHLDRLTREPRNRAQTVQLAAESVAGSLLGLYGRCVPDGDGGAQLLDEVTDDERWRRATVIVNELIRVGLI